MNEQIEIEAIHNNNLDEENEVLDFMQSKYEPAEAFILLFRTMALLARFFNDCPLEGINGNENSLIIFNTIKDTILELWDKAKEIS